MQTIGAAATAEPSVSQASVYNPRPSLPRGMLVCPYQGVSREACSEIGHGAQDSVHLLAEEAGDKGAALL